MNRMKALQKIGPETYAAPENPHGIFAMHCRGEPPTEADFKAIVDGPIARVQTALCEELGKIGDE